MDREDRATRLAAEAERITKELARRGATFVLVFGSFARGRVRRASDLDMIAVMDSDLPFVGRLERLYVEIGPRVGLDLLVYTPEEWAWIRQRTFIRRALKEGRVLHAA